ncbi:unnamed protein product [Dimorphilus gyrociliatus]|uniref:RING-type domain-containing protein n=1 Tax=Dimorphilus gyrociliatus TaxID=2664684 RepID=A0A7I8VA20_9ANNE|nr:unnamed protein product [Dimorphilus gyrociliatus]
MSDLNQICRFCDKILDDIFVLPCDNTHGFCSDCLKLMKESSKYKHLDRLECPLCQKLVEWPSVTISSLERNKIDFEIFMKEETQNLIIEKENVLKKIVGHQKALEKKMDEQVKILNKEVGDYYYNLHEKLKEYQQSFVDYQGLTLSNELSKKYAKDIEDRLRMGVANIMKRQLKFDMNDFQQRFSIGSLSHSDHEKTTSFDGEIKQICSFRQSILVLVLEHALKEKYSVFQLENGKQPNNLVTLDNCGCKTVKLASESHSKSSIYLFDVEKLLLYSLGKRGVKYQLREKFSTEKGWTNIFCVNSGVILTMSGKIVHLDSKFDIIWEFSIDDDLDIVDSKLVDDQLILLLEDTSILVVRINDKSFLYANVELETKYDLSIQDNLIPKLKEGYCCLSNKDLIFLVNPSNLEGTAYKIGKKLRNFRLAFNKVLKDQVILYFVDNNNNLITRNFSL